MSIEAVGQALHVGYPRGPNTFRVNVSNDLDISQIEVGMKGPAQPKLAINNRGAGLLEVSYDVPVVGAYSVHVTYGGQNIPGSPYNVTIR